MELEEVVPGYPVSAAHTSATSTSLRYIPPLEKALSQIAINISHHSTCQSFTRIRVRSNMHARSLNLEDKLLTPCGWKFSSTDEFPCDCIRRLVWDNIPTHKDFAWKVNIMRCYNNAEIELYTVFNSGRGPSSNRLSSYSSKYQVKRSEGRSNK